MSRQKSRGQIQAECIAAAAAAACLCASPLPAAQSTAPGADTKSAAPRPTRPPTSGPGSLTGVWSNPAFKDYRTGPPVGREPTLETAERNPIPFRPEVAKILEQKREDARNGKPVAGNGSYCLPGGMPSMMRPPAELSLQILETSDQVTVLFEFYGTFRIIHLNEKHQPDPDPTYFGDSVGHWEGNTLVVDTIGLTDKTMLFGAPHSENLHIVERIRRTGPTTLEDSMTIEDPKTFTKPFNWLVTLKQFPGMRIGEFVCDNQRNGVGVNGETGVQLQGAGR